MFGTTPATNLNHEERILNLELRLDRLQQQKSCSDGYHDWDIVNPMLGSTFTVTQMGGVNYSPSPTMSINTNPFIRCKHCYTVFKEVKKDKPNKKGAPK